MKKAQMADWARMLIGGTIITLVVFFTMFFVLRLAAAKEQQLNLINQDMHDYSVLLNFLRMPLNENLLTTEEKVFVEKYNVQNNADLISFIVAIPDIAEPPYLEWISEQAKNKNLAKDILEKDIAYLPDLLKYDLGWEMYTVIEFPPGKEHTETLLRSCGINGVCLGEGYDINQEIRSYVSKNHVTEIYLPRQMEPGKVTKLILSTPRSKEKWYS